MGITFEVYIRFSGPQVGSLKQEAGNMKLVVRCHIQDNLHLGLGEQGMYIVQTYTI
jgi:hypothetical protein